MNWHYILFSVCQEYSVILPAALFCLIPVQEHLRTHLSPTLFLGAVSGGIVLVCLLLGTKAFILSWSPTILPCSRSLQWPCFSISGLFR